MEIRIYGDNGEPTQLSYYETSDVDVRIGLPAEDGEVLYVCTHCQKEIADYGSDGWQDDNGGVSCDGEGSVHEPEAVPFDWLNSVGVELRPEENAVNLFASVGDPRGAFKFTIRKLEDGGLLIHTPYEGELVPHRPTRQLHPGTLEVL